MSSRHALLPACVGFTIVAFTATACSRSLPTTPDTASPAAAAHAKSGGGQTVTFPLTGGTLSITTGRGHTISGTYSGESQFRSGVETSILAVTVTGGTGAFDGGSGTLTGIGWGAFAGEGAFALALQGKVAMAGRPSQLRVNLRGQSAASCGGQEIRITQTGEGTASGHGRVTGTLIHDVGNTGCDF